MKIKILIDDVQTVYEVENGWLEIEKPNIERNKDGKLMGLKITICAGAVPSE